MRCMVIFPIRKLKNINQKNQLTMHSHIIISNNANKLFDVFNAYDLKYLPNKDLKKKF